MTLKEAVRAALADLGISEVGFLDYRHVREINSRLITRAGLTPRSVITFLVPYFAGEAENLSVYAAGPDYHRVIARITDSVISVIREHRPDSHSVGFGDHSPIDERQAAMLSGLGALGKNGLIINKKYGSYVFIGDVVTDIPPDELGCNAPKDPVPCEGCGRCLKACPTGVLRGESTECLSAITQTKGELSCEQISLMKEYDTCWGCDVCSRVCPHNSTPMPSPIRNFYEGRIKRLTRGIVDGMSDEEFSSRAFGWRGRKTVLRNLEYLYGENNGENQT